MHVRRDEGYLIEGERIARLVKGAIMIGNHLQIETGIDNSGKAG